MWITLFILEPLEILASIGGALTIHRLWRFGPMHHIRLFGQKIMWINHSLWKY